MLSLHGFVMKILTFILFLIAYAIPIIVVSRRQAKVKAGHLIRNIFLNSQVDALLTVFAFFATLYLLAGYFDVKFLILYFGLIESSLLIFLFLGFLLGPGATHWIERVQWMGGELALKHPLLVGMAFFISIPILFAYLIIIGINYFGTSTSSSELTIIIFKWHVITSFFGLLMASLFTVATLASKNIDPLTRMRIFAGTVGALLILAFYLSLLSWALGIAGTGNQLDFGKVGGIPISLSPELMLILVSFFLITALVPYVVGFRAAKTWRLELLKMRQEALNKLIEILQFPINAPYVDQIAELKEQLLEEVNEFIAGEKIVRFGDEIDQGSKPATQLVAVAAAYRVCRNEDPRFQYIDWVRGFSPEIETIIEDLTAKSGNPDLISVAQQWATPFETRKQGVIKEIDQVSQARPAVLLGLGFFLIVILTLVFEEFAKWIWDIFSTSLSAS